MTKLEIKNVNRRQFVTGAAALGLGTLSACSSPRGKSFDAQIIILGAGLSGLHAARLLESEGRDVLVVEGSTRIGGRVQTLRHAGGAYTEAGGEQVGATYARLRDTAEQLDIQLTADSPARRGTSYAFEGKTYSAEAWSKLTDHPFSPPFKGASPTSPLFRLAARNNPLKNADDWQLESFTPFDMSAREFLSRNGFETAAQDIIGHALNGNNLDTYSMMNLYRSLQIYTQSLEAGPSMSIAGGAQRLPEAMAASLSRDVMTNFMVSRIEVTDEAVTIVDKSGRRLKAEQCICALPFGALRNIDISAPLSPPQRDAIKGLAYTQILQLHFKIGQPYWETDGLPPDMWMAGPLERIFINHDASGNPTPFGRAWINGDAAAKLAQLSDTDLQELLRAELSSSRAIKSGDIELLAVKRWTAQNSYSGGAYMHWQPAQIRNWASVMGARAGRLSFAGEHLSLMHTGLEGAMEAGENAAFALMDV